MAKKADTTNKQLQRASKNKKPKKTNKKIASIQTKRRWNFDGKNCRVLQKM